LYDFDPAADSVNELQPVDRWALSRFERYRGQVLHAYDAYEFHRIYHATVDLCAIDLSAFYFDVLKDRTYCSGKRWPELRAAQTDWRARSPSVTKKSWQIFSSARPLASSRARSRPPKCARARTGRASAAGGRCRTSMFQACARAAAGRSRSRDAFEVEAVGID